MPHPGSHLQSILFFVGPRAITIYLLAFLGLRLVSDYPAAMVQARTSAINRLMPNFNYLVVFRDGQIPFSKEKFQEYFHYFHKINAYSPNRPEILSLLGYCAYYLGDEKKAQAYYQQAAALRPRSFAPYYNLGALCFKKGDFQNAVAQFKSSLAFDHRTVLLHILSSRVNFPLMKDHLNLEQELMTYLKKGYERCYRLLVASYAALNDPLQELEYALQAATQPLQDPAFFYYHAGKASLQIGHPEKAVTLLTKSLDLYPKNPEALRSLGLALQAMKEKNMAEKILAQAEQLRADGYAAPAAGPVDLQIY